MEDLVRSWRESYKTLRPVIAGYLNLALYLCAEERDLSDGAGGVPVKPLAVRTRKHGARIFPPDRPHGWQVGWRIGAAISHAKALAGAVVPDGGTHASPRPHVRRAHWHTFLAGAGRSERRLKWLAPIAVNVTDGDTVAVVHPVTKRGTHD